LLDIDAEFNIGLIKGIQYDEGSFYILANKRQGKLGYFLMSMDERRPIIKNKNGLEELNGELIVNWQNKLDIGDANMHVLKNEKYKYKELVVSYKSIYINTFNVMVVDLADKVIVFRHESFQLWES